MASPAHGVEQAYADQSRVHDMEANDSNDSRAELTAAEKSTESPGRKWELNFHFVSIFVGLNHAAEDVYNVYVAEIYGDAALSQKLLGITFLTWMVSSVFLAAPISKKLGPKALVVLGLMLYCIQYVVYITVSHMSSGSVAQEVVGALGALCAGLGTTCMFAGEGSFFASTAQLVAKLDKRDLSEVNTTISSIFGFWYLFIEFLAKISFFGLREVGVPRDVNFVAVCVIAIVATAVVWVFVLPVPRQVDEADEKSGAEESAVSCQDAFETILLWRDPRIWLISFLVFAFGMASALNNGDICNQYVTPQLGAIWKSLFSSSVALVAALIQVPFMYLAKRFGKGLVLATGAISVILLPSLPLVLGMDVMQDLGWGLVVFFLLQGVIRGNFATVTKAIYADHFPDPDSDAAFSNWSMHAALGFSVTYIMQGFDVEMDYIAIMLLVTGVLIMPGYWAASLLQQRWMPKMQHDIESNAKVSSTH